MPTSTTDSIDTVRPVLVRWAEGELVPPERYVFTFNNEQVHSAINHNEVYVSAIMMAQRYKKAIFLLPRGGVVRSSKIFADIQRELVSIMVSRHLHWFDQGLGIKGTEGYTTHITERNVYLTWYYMVGMKKIVLANRLRQLADLRLVPLLADNSSDDVRNAMTLFEVIDQLGMLE